MNPRKITGPIGFAVMSAVTLAQGGCNPQTTALSLFANQGLNLLKPARDYIKPGGMVFVPKHGLPEYDDPKDAPSKNGNLTDFRASILSEALNKKGAFDASLSLATQVVPMPISAGAQSSDIVSLQGFETTGVRMDTNDLDKFIQMPNTSAAAATELKNGSRVFIVQEIYKATSMSLHAEDGRAFHIKLANGDPVVDCTQSGQTNSSKTGAGQQGTQTGQQGTKTGQQGTQSANGTPSAKTPASPTTTLTATITSGGKTATSSASGSQSSSTSKLGAGLSYCIDRSYTLQLTAKDPIPFAVRLAELKLSGNTVERIRGTVLKATLGAGSEISADLIDKSSPVIVKLQKIQRKNP